MPSSYWKWFGDGEAALWLALRDFRGSYLSLFGDWWSCSGRFESWAFLYTFADAVRFLEEIVMVALATAVQEVFAFSPIVVVVPAWKGAFTGSDNWSCSTWILTDRSLLLTGTLWGTGVAPVHRRWDVLDGLSEP